MRAMVITQFSGPDVFEHHEIERSAPDPGEGLVRVIASGDNSVDAKIRHAGTWAQIPFPAVLGYDVSGVIEALEPGMVEFNMGDEVFYTPEIFGNRHGSYVEYTIASASIVASKPTNLSHVQGGRYSPRHRHGLRGDCPAPECPSR